MNPAATQTIVCEGWRLNLADGGLRPGLREAVVARALEAARGELGAPRRRSRHASTWQIRIGAGTGSEIFIKLLDAPRGLGAIKQLLRGGRASHVARVTRDLNDSGFLAPPLLVYGRETASGREIIVTPGAEGDGPLRTLKALRAGAADVINRKRTVLRALGAEIARLHRCGFVHGDLTPFNIFFVRAEPPRFVLIDHERTRRTGPIGRRRRTLRNLVQLGRFDLPGLSATDRMRILAGYTAMLERRDRRRVTRRVNAMLGRRIRRDGVARVETPADRGAVS
jgi:tRNA A-37 threonylcarbamoyl transferase component Bud32